MQIVLPGALPDPREARELTSYLLEAAPTFVRWLQQSRASVQPVDVAETGCTPYEQWLLKARGFTPKSGQNLNAGLGPLWADNVTKRDEAIWLAELVHVSPSREGATLLPARDLSITSEQSVALFESAQSLFAGSGFALRHDSSERWRVDIPLGFMPRCASPSLVSITSVNDWWPQDAASRPWRRLVNELQMLWFEHPVNQARYTQGRIPINSLWLFGGASQDQFTDTPLTNAPQTYEALSAPALAHDWGGWITALAELEKRVFQPLAQRKTAPGLVLIGREKIIELTPRTLGRWTQWLPGSRDTWRKWWSPQN